MAVLVRRVRESVIGFALAIAVVVTGVGAGTAQAQIGSERYSSIVIDAADGTVLSAVSPDEARYPASLTKMMTLYMVFEAVRDRRIWLAELVPISLHAASMSPTKLGLLPNTRITVEQAILGLITKSANDAAAALGEMLGGDEDRFAQMMTLRARALGMSRTAFRNASGLPDPEQVTTARDMALLARHLLQDFPVEYRYFSTPSFVFRGRTIFNHDGLLRTYPGADGLKTGYIEASGFNLVTSAMRGDVRLIGVVMGAAHPGERDLHMAALLDRGFGQMDVPVEPHREWQAAARMPGLMSAAQASPLMPSPLVPGLRGPASHLALPDGARLRMPAARWSVQVGAFASESAARQAAAAAHRAVEVGDPRLEAVSARGRTSWRAQLVGLSQSEAHAVCVTLTRRRMACVPVRPETGQFASR